MAVVDLGFTDIFEEAFEMAGESFHTARDVQLARRALNFLMDEWANRGLNLWTINQSTVACVADTADYTLPTDTIDLIEHVIQSTDGNTEYHLRRVSVGEYAKFSKKLTTGRPTTVYVQRINSPQVTLWPIPDDTYTFKFWYLSRLEGLSSGITGSPDMPARFRPALAAGIAARIAVLKQKWDIAPMLAAEYEKQWIMAAEEDRDRASYWARPHIGRVV